MTAQPILQLGCQMQIACPSRLAAALAHLEPHEAISGTGYHMQGLCSRSRLVNGEHEACTGVRVHHIAQSLAQSALVTVWQTAAGLFIP